VTTTLKLSHLLSDRIVSINAGSYRYRHDKLIALGHGIDTQLFAPSPRGDIENNQPLLLSVARLSPLKDLLTFVHSVYLVRQKGYDIQAAFVGSVPDRDRVYAQILKNRVEQLGLKGVVQFVGGVSQDQVAKWYRRCFVHVNCAPADHALDKAVLEAMACGKPSLSSVLGFQETMGEQAYRLLFRHGDPDDLAEKLTALLELPPAEREYMGHYLSERVVRMHSLERLAEVLISLLCELERKS
jgi:glycosyltransferase involved in cell wall biosynthesis